MPQQSLFPEFFADLLPPPVPPVPGLALHQDWIDSATERRLVAAADGERWQQHYQRRTQHYGGDYRSGLPVVTPPLPRWLAVVGRRLQREGFLPREPEQAGVNEYVPGQGIAHHCDDLAYAAPVIILSLGSACRFELLHPERRELHGFTLRPRSLLLLAGDARWLWRHGIPARKSDVIEGVRCPRGRRISLTFRIRAHPSDAGAPADQQQFRAG